MYCPTSPPPLPHTHPPHFTHTPPHPQLLADLKAEEARLRSLVDKTDEELSHALDAEREAAVAAYEAAMVERGTEVGLDVAVVGADVLEMWGAEEAKVKLAEEEEDNTADHVAALDARTAELETLVAANKTTLLEKRDEVLAQHKINTRQAATLIAKHNQKIRMPEDPEIIKEYLNELKRYALLFFFSFTVPRSTELNNVLNRHRSTIFFR